MSEIYVQIHTKIMDPHGEVEEWQHQYKGNLYLKNDQDVYLKYEENEEQSLGKTSTILKWNQQANPFSVTIIRQGEIKSNQTFQEGKQHTSFYQSPHGAIEMTVSPRKANLISEQWDQGRIELDYDLVIDNQNVGQYQISIVYHP